MVRAAVTVASAVLVLTLDAISAFQRAPQIGRRVRPFLAGDQDAVTADDQVVVEVRKTLPVPADAAYGICLDGWRGGFGLPLLAIGTQEGDETGLGFEVLRVPPFLREQITQATPGQRMEYQVMNPGLLTYQVKDGSHLGTITFRKAAGGGTEMEWRVVFDPLPGWRVPMQLLTEVIIGTCAGWVESQASAK